MQLPIFAISLLTTKIDMKKSQIEIQSFNLTEQETWKVWYTTDDKDGEVEITPEQIAAKVQLDEPPPNITLDQMHHEKMLRFRYFMARHIQEDILKEIISELKFETK